MTYPIKCHVRAEGGVTRVDVFDDIGEGWFGGGLTARDFSAQMSTLKGSLDIHINSGGGSVSDGVAIANAIRAHKGHKRTIVDGMAASIASVIMQAGDERIVEPGAMVMIHDAFSDQPVGNEESGRRIVESLRKHSENIANQYAERAGGTAEHWREIMREETWFTAEEAVEAGLADRIGAGAAALPQRFDLAAIHSIPGRIVNALRTLPTMRREADGTVIIEHAAKTIVPADSAACPHCGATPDMKAAGGKKKAPKTIDPDQDGDDDTTAEGDTDHDYVDEDGEQIQPMPGKKGKKAKVGKSIRNSEVDNSAWDAAKAWHNGAESDDPEAFYRGICAGKKSGDPSTQAGWALPYKYHPDDPPNAAGVRAALAALGGARGGVQGLINRKEAEDTLETAMRKINPDYEPDNLDLSLLSAALLHGLGGGL